MFESKRELKSEIERLASSLSVANETGERRLKEISTLRLSVASQKKKNDALVETNKELANKTKKLGAVVRKQTESDILLNALAAVGIIKNDSSEQPDRAGEHKRLIQQRNFAAQAMGSAASPFPGFGGCRGQSLFDSIFG